MAAGAAPAPAPEPKADAKNETVEASEAQPLTLKQRVVGLLHEIFAGREDHMGWRQ
jgi:hypothetical protein